MSDSHDPHHEALLALGRVAAEGSEADGPEEALWCVTRALPALLGDPAAALRPHAYREAEPPQISGAAVAFMRTPDGRHHLNLAPVNFLPGQHHELIDIALGHPAWVARTRRPLLLADTTLHPAFVKILQTFRAGSSVFAPILWRGDYLGVLICANAARGTFGERDLATHGAFANLAAALWMAHDGPAWVAALDLLALPVRESGT